MHYIQVLQQQQQLLIHDELQIGMQVMGFQLNEGINTCISHYKLSSSQDSFPSSSMSSGMSNSSPDSDSAIGSLF